MIINTHKRTYMEQNIKQFVVDIGCKNMAVRLIKDRLNGTLSFKLVYKGLDIYITMPGDELHKVRYLGLSKQNIFDFPYVTVDEKELVWLCALGEVRRLIKEHLNNKVTKEPD